MTLHAHLQFESRDCDSRFTSSRKAEMTAEEKASAFGDLEFKRRIMGEMVSVVAKDGTLVVEEDRISWHENTEEGYRTGDAEWCEKNCEGSVY